MGLLKMYTYAWNPSVNDKTWAHSEVIAVDCTSGNGHTEDGAAGSPLLINEWALRSYGFNFRQLCCERVPASFARLAANELPQAEMMIGSYQETAPGWLEGLGVGADRRALGFIYCDPNGAKDLLDGLDFFHWVAADPRFARLDFIFHWSLTAYQRNFGANITWANESLADIIQQLRSLKQRAIVREPIDKHRWVIMYLFNSDKVNGQWRKEGFIPPDEWVDRYLVGKGQQSLFDDEVLAEYAT